MTKVIDFDAFRAEQKAEPVELKLGGRTYALPSSLPASMALDIIRRNLDDANAEMEPTVLIDMGAGIFGGQETFDQLLRENSITMSELPELFRMVMAAYSGGEPDAPNPESLLESETTLSA